MKVKSKYHDDFVNFLKQDKWNNWSIWFTATFRQTTYPTRAKRQLKKFFEHINTPNEKIIEKFILSWVFFEKNKVERGIHLHAIISGIDSNYCELLEKKANRFFGKSEVKPIHKNSIPYLADKYDTAYLYDFDFLTINPR